MANAPGITVRMLGEDDWELWRALRLRALADAPEAFCSTLAEWSGAADVERRWRDRLASVALNLVAEAGGDAVGMVSGAAPSGGVVELTSMWVAPEARGRGAGAALVAAVLSWAARRGARSVALDVRAQNAPAIALYARQGFADAEPSQGTGASRPRPGGAGPCERRMVRAVP